MRWLLSIVAIALVACGDDAKVSDITVVRAYFVTCDSALSLNYCYGPSHRAGTEDFTVIISKNEVKRDHAFLTFHDCQVTSPHRWDCLDTKNQLVTMRGVEMRWDELTEAHQAAVAKLTFCMADVVKGKKSGFLDRALCAL